MLQQTDYFWSPADPPDSTTIFDNLSEYNPQCYSSTGVNGGPVVLSWLRKSDRQVYERTWFKITRHWIGSPVGFWDSDLYTSGNRPDGVSVLYDVQSIPCLKQADWTAAKNAGMTLFQ